MKRYAMYQLLIAISFTVAICAMDIGQLYRHLDPHAIGEGNIKLISKDGAEFIVPLAVAKQSETIERLLSDIGTTQIDLDLISTGTLKEIVELLKELPKHTALKHRALLDALDNTVMVKDNVALLYGANYLDINPIIHLVARKIAQQEKERIAAEYKITQFFKTPEIAKKLPKDLLKIVAHYYFLLTDKNYPGIPENDYSFSIEDYLDYQPYKIRQTLKVEEEGTVTSVNYDLSHLHLNSLEGLYRIPYIFQVSVLRLTNNKLEIITPDDFIDLKKISYLYLDHNRLKEVSISNLTKLTILDLSNNKLTHVKMMNLPSLWRLGLGHNEFSEIKDQFKIILNDLRILDLSYNKITIIKADTFSGVSKELTALDLRNNKLTQIEPEAFAGLIWGEIELRDNNLKYIPVEAFDPARKSTDFSIWIDKTITPENRRELKVAFPQLQINP